MAWLPGYAYRKPLVITGGASGAQTDFQLDINIAHVAAKMQADFDDIRFTQNNGTTLIDAWLESKVDSASAKTWTEFPTTPANTVEQTYYMYYGKVVGNYWDGAATFLQYHGVASADFIDSLVIDPTNNYAFETIARVTADIHNLEIGLGQDIVWTGDKAFIQSYNPEGHNLRYLQTLNNSIATQVSETPQLTINQWYDGLLTFDGTTVRGYWDSNEIGSGSTTNLPDQLMGLFLHDVSGGAEIKWAFVRKYVANPPTYAFGAEESAPTGAAPTSVIYGPLIGPLGGPI